jgi:CRISPR-associated protein Cas1
LVTIRADGIVSLEALRWCHALGVGVFVLGPDGSLQLTSTPRITDDARLRRTQALAPLGPVGLDIARDLLGAKLWEQAAFVRNRLDKKETPETILGLADAIDALTSGSGAGPTVFEQARQIEASAAALYFGTWSRRPETSPMFASRDRTRVPAHWTTFEGRRSVLASASANRKAERPVNALLNCGFALLEAEAIRTCSAVGLDPGLGIVHANAKGRASVALDLIEPVRPEVEACIEVRLKVASPQRGDLT